MIWCLSVWITIIKTYFDERQRLHSAWALFGAERQARTRAIGVLIGSLQKQESVALHNLIGQIGLEFQVVRIVIDGRRGHNRRLVLLHNDFACPFA